MTTDREQILGSIRRSLHRDTLPANRAAALRAAMKNPAVGVVPARGQLASFAERLELFRRMAEKLFAVVTLLPSGDDIPLAVAAYLESLELPPVLTAAPALDSLAWEAAGLDVRAGVPEPTDRVGITQARFGVAETGTLVMESGPATPSTLNFLPDIHIVVLHADTLVGTFEEVWAARRTNDQPMPRTLTMITGPSRTGDIDLVLVRGAHGPRALHILVVEAA